MASTSIIFDLVGRDRASGDFDRVGRSAQRTGGKLRALSRIGKVAALGLAGGAAAASVGLFKLAQGAAEDEVSAKKMALAFRNAAGATDKQIAGIENWITKAGIAKGVADDELRPALAKLVAATGDVGKAQKLTGLAMNVSAGTGKSLATVSQSIAKAQNGNVAALGKLGISTKDAKGKTVDLQTALGRLAKVHKGAAATSANTYEGKMRRLKLVLSETGESIGYKLLPILTKLATWFLNDGLPKLTAFGNYLGRVLPPLWANLQAKIVPVIAWLRANVPPTFERIKAVVLTAVNGLASGTGERMGKVREIFTSAVSIIKSLWSTFGPAITGFVIPAMRNIQQVVGGVLTWLAGAFKVVASVLKGDWGGAWNGIKQMVRGAAGIIVGTVKQLWATIKFAFSSAGAALKGIAGAMWEGIKDKFIAAGGRLTAFLQSLPGKFQRAFGDAGGILLQVGKDIISGLAKGIGDATGISKVAGAVTKVAGAIPGIARKVVDSHSPSRKMIPIGQSIPDGLAVGMRKGTPTAEKAAKEMAKRVEKAAKAAAKAAAQRLKDFRDRMATIVNARNETRNSFLGGIFGDGSGEGGQLNASGMIAAAAAQVAKMKAFARSIAGLRKMGLNKFLIQQLVSQGVDVGGSNAASLLAGGRSSVSQMNTQFRNLSAQASLLADQQSLALYKMTGAQAEAAHAPRRQTVVNNVVHVHGFAVGTEKQLVAELEKMMGRYVRDTGRPMQVRTV